MSFSELAPSKELSERLKKARKMLKEKILKSIGVDVDSKDYSQLVKLITLVSSDPETSRRVLAARETYKRVCGTAVVMKFNKEELKALMEGLGGLQSFDILGRDILGDLRRKLSDAYTK